MGNLDGKVAIVSGAAQGLGEADVKAWLSSTCEGLSG